jgi:uncharacterized protein (DUF2384 family)
MASHPGSSAVQTKLREIARIITRAAELAGNKGKAILWFKHQPIPGYDQTPKELVANGHAQLVIGDLERMAVDVYS